MLTAYWKKAQIDELLRVDCSVSVNNCHTLATKLIGGNWLLFWWVQNHFLIDKLVSPGFAVPVGWYADQYSHGWHWHCFEDPVDIPYKTTWHDNEQVDNIRAEQSRATHWYSAQRPTATIKWWLLETLLIALVICVLAKNSLSQNLARFCYIPN